MLTCNVTVNCKGFSHVTLYVIMTLYFQGIVSPSQSISNYSGSVIYPF